MPAVLWLFPVIAQNLDLFGQPTLAVFDTASGLRFVYSRVLDGQILTFHAGERGKVIDRESGSVWDLQSGIITSDPSSGKKLASSAYSVEDIFPYRGVTIETNPLLAGWQRFDANWYLAIARAGYEQAGSTVYLPLYPLLIRAANFLVGNELVAALVVSNLALLGALYYLYRLTEGILGDAAARRTVVFLLFFPTGFFLYAPYGESLFLFLSLGALVFAQRERWGLSIMFGMLAALTRLQGALLVLPLGYLAWKQVTARRLQFTDAYRLIGLLLIPAATGAFLVFTNVSLLSTYEGELHARFVMPWENVGTAIGTLISGQGSPIDALNLILTALFGLMLVAVWRALPREYFVYALAMYAAPLFRMTTTQPLVSIDRYVLMLFPVFVLWGAWGQNPWVTRAVVYLSFPLSLYLSAQFALWGWVG